MKKIKVINYLLLPIILGLIFSMLINGVHLVFGEDKVINSFASIYTRDIRTDVATYIIKALTFTGIIHFTAVILLVISILKAEFLPQKNSVFLKWGIFTFIWSLVIYGFVLRVISNNQGAANVFYYIAILYFLLWFIEYKSIGNQKHLDKVKVIPIFLVLFYTMGVAGYQKLFNASSVLPRYTEMFKESILAKMPIGVTLFIYFIGLLEVIVPVLLLVSFYKKEFLKSNDSFFFNLSAILSVIIFIYVRVNTIINHLLYVQKLKSKC